MNMIEERSFQFALKIIQLVKVLREFKEYVFADQILRAATRALVLMLPKREQDNLKRTLFLKWQLLLKKQEKLDIGYVY